MALVGTLLFCTDCGNLLEYPSPSATKTIICQICDAPNPNKWPTSVQTTSKPDAFPSALGQKHSEIQTIEEGDIETWAEILQACSKCVSEVQFQVWWFGFWGEITANGVKVEDG
ncbi:DNA-directed RNA polymerase complex I subunit Rpa12 [Pyrenophora tritici-repentis Pt-1C-BFP]|uniref:DNA-directed RNA polymerase complex I subunit Rpa12 n=1 Tax=Pyrenophora tritici-repentis (strain Pt-1C-BFP) TaxID=426418 RepID=B2W442_PYRTR|nr:DNA-directed RNA polymerase complex I subunit Rpa12 [Pyrenophora tritici-repentis Pt-1C-BFP]EDU48149.1 DNA-directed RNA polymerase complex I subunit Rpa12 [Pyrenophora tritici-repentis Pt-1C-BFP]